MKLLPAPDGYPFQNKDRRRIAFPAWRAFTRGQGIVEFALVIPVMFFIMFGVLEFGRLLFLYIDVAVATREAARYGVAIGDNGNGTPYYVDCAGIRDAAIRVGAPAGVSAGDVTIQWHLENGDYTSCTDILAAGDVPKLGSTINVGISVPFTPLILGGGILPVNLTSHAQRSYITRVYSSN
jgi:Flp pilus assembly protein TadG